MDILVIGNGFDLAHGLKTSYKDFLLACQKEFDDFMNRLLWNIYKKYIKERGK